MFNLLTLIWFTNKILGKKPKSKKAIPNPVPLPKSPTPPNNNLSNLRNVTELKESCNNIKYPTGNNKDNNNNSVNFRNFIASATNFFIAIFKNYKKTYR